MFQNRLAWVLCHICVYHSIDIPSPTTITVFWILATIVEPLSDIIVEKIAWRYPQLNVPQRHIKSQIKARDFVKYLVKHRGIVSNILSFISPAHTRRSPMIRAMLPLGITLDNTAGAYMLGTFASSMWDPVQLMPRFWIDVSVLDYSEGHTSRWAVWFGCLYLVPPSLWSYLTGIQLFPHFQRQFGSSIIKGTGNCSAS